MVVAPTVTITDSNAEGPSVIDRPTCQRVAVLKNLPWSAIDPMKMCGGGRSLGSAQPNSQHSSHRLTNRPIDRQLHMTFASAPSPAIEANRRATAAGREVARLFDSMADAPSE